MRQIIFISLMIACDSGDSKVTIEEEGDTIIVDADGDGFVDDDCDDDDALINPGQEEVCDGLDNNCDGLLVDAVYSSARVQSWRLS